MCGRRFPVPRTRPRISVFRSNRGLSAQLIDDVSGRTLAAVNWYEPELRAFEVLTGPSAQARCSPSAPRRPASEAVFDRGGYRYHGHVTRVRRGDSARPVSPSRLATRYPLSLHVNRDRSVNAGGLDLQERVVEINRVAKVVKGGRRFSFTALVVVGDEREVVGVGYGKANEVPLAIQKGVERAKKDLFRVPKHGRTITHQTTGSSAPGGCSSSRQPPVPA